MQKWIGMLFIGLALGVGLWRLILWMDVTRPECSADHPCRNKFCKYCGIPDAEIPHYQNAAFGGDDEREN